MAADYFDPFGDHPDVEALPLEAAAASFRKTLAEIQEICRNDDSVDAAGRAARRERTATLRMRADLLLFRSAAAAGN